MEKTAIIIPALEKNRYHDRGDLAPFGDTSLLEWKLSQVKRAFDPGSIYVSSPSEEILAIARSQGVKTIRREADLSLTDMIAFSIERVDAEIALWTNVTSPFMNGRDYAACLRAYEEARGERDSLLTVHPLREYVFYRTQPLNFGLHQHISRTVIEPVHIVTNGCFIIARDLALRMKSYIGEKPLLFEVDQLTSLEIKDFSDLTIANDLLTLYMRTKEID